jgi:parallel beta-helix repeat protein
MREYVQMKKLAAFFVCLLLAITCQAKIIYVDADANGLNDGSTWANSYNYLQDALADANSAEKPVEIRVAKGIYRPDEDTLHPDGTGDRTATFQLINGVTVKGGYAGAGTPDPNLRNIKLYEAILSGDIGRLSDNSDNCYHIFYHPEGLNLNDTAILDGFTITSGNANGGDWPDNAGGGMYNYYRSSPTITNCAFNGNSAILYGGGMYNYRYSRPTVKDCTFSDNSAVYGGGTCNYDNSSPTVRGCVFSGNSAYFGGGMFSEYYSSPTVRGCVFSGNSVTEWGGGMFNYDNSSPTLANCTFSGNSANWSGGGMYNYYSRPTLTNCTFSGNLANEYGGGMDNYDNSSPTVANCIFSGNSANWSGGGMYNYYNSNPTLTNCTIVDNNAPNGPAMACDSLLQSSPSTIRMVNSIVWNGLCWLWNNDKSVITVTYSDVQYGGRWPWPGRGNIVVDPRFADPANGDYHLKSQAGRWQPNEGRWMKDDVTSPCIDAGEPSSPIGLEPFPNGGIVNMGAYGGTEEASKSYFGEPVCETIVAGDINGDCKVDFKDFAIFADNWLRP